MPGLIFDPGDAPVGNTFRIVHPRFGTTCVCCNADAKGNTATYDLFDARMEGQVRAPPVPMPVCQACMPHAFLRTAAMSGMAIVVTAGLLAMVLGALLVFAKSPAGGYPLCGGGLVFVVIGIVWDQLRKAREQREVQPGHFPHLRMAVVPGATVLHSDNEVLISELLALNSNANRYVPPAG